MLRSLLFVLALALSTVAVGSEAVTLHKTPSCGCCEDYADYLRDNGFRVEVIPTHDLPGLKAEQGVPEKLGGCHTSLIEGYVFEGHIPVDSIRRVLDERPDITGLSVPGMPTGSPGMGGSFDPPMPVWTIPATMAGHPRVFTRYRSADSWR